MTTRQLISRIMFFHEQSVLADCFMLILLCFVLYLPGLATLPVTDRDEARFAQATKQMLETGDYIRINFQDQPRHKKPIGIHWLQAASVKTLSTSSPDHQLNSIWMYRLPSTIGAILAVLFTCIIGRTLFDPKTARLAATLLAISLLLIVESHIATTDAALLATVIATQGSLALIYNNQKKLNSKQIDLLPITFWTTLAIGILLKGPMLPAVTLLTTLTLIIADRSARLLTKLKIHIGLPILILLLAPWAIAIHRATDGTFFREAIFGDLIPKLISSHESHGMPPGYYLVLFAITFWPGSLLTGLALKHTWTKRTLTPHRFLLAWLIPSWIMLELIPTKLPHYSLPLYPAAALITAHFITNNRLPQKQLIYRIGFIIWWLIGLALTVLPIIALIQLGSGLTITTTLISIIITTLITFSLIKVWTNQHLTATILSILAAVLLTIQSFTIIAPNLDKLWLSRNLAQLIQPTTPTEPIISFGYHEPSLIFQLGTKTQLRSPHDINEITWNIWSPPAWCIVPTDDDSHSTFLEGTKRQGFTTHHIGTVTGINYNKGSNEQKWSVYHITHE